jgi:hypothetical protein
MYFAEQTRTTMSRNNDFCWSEPQSHPIAVRTDKMSTIDTDIFYIVINFTTQIADQFLSHESEIICHFILGTQWGQHPQV